MADINVTATSARHEFSHWLNRVSLCNDRVLIVRHGRLLGVLVSPGEYERFQQPAAAAAEPEHPPDEMWQLLKASVAAKRYCARCSNALPNDPIAQS